MDADPLMKKESATLTMFYRAKLHMVHMNIIPGERLLPNVSLMKRDLKAKTVVGTAGIPGFFKV